MAFDIRKTLQTAQKSVDGASLAVLRVGIGLLIVYDALRKGGLFFTRNEGKAFTFPLHGFEWVPTAGQFGDEVSWLWAACGSAVALGLCYRAAIALAFLLAGWGFVQAQEYYLNHYYLLLLVTFLMIWVPAHRTWSVDAYLWTVRPVRRIHVWLLKGQVEIVLLYAGIVKINHDWLHGEPLRSWLIERRDAAVFGFLFDHDAIFYAASYGSIALHIIGAPLLFFKSTRLPVFLVYCLFHLSNHHLFNIGIFPWMTIALTTIFFSPDWPRQVLFHGRGGELRTVSSADNFRAAGASKMAHVFAIAALLWLAVQALFPLRHYLHEGDVAWTYEAHKFSWRMKLVDRESAGLMLMSVDSAAGKTYIAPLERLLSLRQARKVSTRPRLVVQLAQQQKPYLKSVFAAEIDRVHAYVPVSVNGRPYELLVKPYANLLDVHPETPARRWMTLEMESRDPARKPRAETHRMQPASAHLVLGLLPPSGCTRHLSGWLVCETDPAKLAENKAQPQIAPVNQIQAFSPARISASQTVLVPGWRSAQ